MNEYLRREILTETYEDMKKLIVGVTYKFWLLHGGDFEDLKGQANLLFIKALDRYDPERSALTTWITIRIEKGLLDYIKRDYRFSCISISDELVECCPAFPNFSVMDLIDNLGQDAHVVLSLFLSTPREILSSIRDEKVRTNHVASCIKNRLRNRLRQMGWNRRRIVKAFNEIKVVTSY